MKYGTFIYLLRKLMHLPQDKFGKQMNKSIPSSYKNNYIPNSLDVISRIEHNHPKYCSKAVKAVTDTDFMESLQQELKKIYNEFDTNIDNFQAQIVALLAARKDSSSNNISKYYKQSVYNNIDQFIDDLFSKVKSCTMADKQSEDDFYQNVLKGTTFNIEPIHNSQVQNNTQITHLPFPNPTPSNQSALPNDINLEQSPVQDDASPNQSALPNDINLEQSPVQDDVSPNQSALPNDINLQQSPVQDNASPTQSVLSNDINLQQSPVQDDSFPTQLVLPNDINLEQSPVQDNTSPNQSVLPNDINLQQSPVQDNTSPTQSVLPNDINLEQSPVQDDASPNQSVLPNDINLEQSPVQDDASPNQSALPNDINLQQSPVQDNASPNQSALPNDINLEQSPVQDDSLPTQSVLSNDINLQQSPVQDDSLPVQPKYLDSTQPTISKHFNISNRNVQNISSSDIQIAKTFIQNFSEIVMNCLLWDPTAVSTEISFLDALENTLNIWDFNINLISNESVKEDLLALHTALKQYYNLFDFKFTIALEDNNSIYFLKDTEENREYFEHVVSLENLKLRQKISELWTNILKNYK